MLSGLYARWMTAWETDLTTRDTNRVVRPLEWGFDWLSDFSNSNSPGFKGLGLETTGSHELQHLDRMITLNEEIVRRSQEFFTYSTPQDFRIERRHPALFPTNVRPETLAQDAEMKRQAADGELSEA